ncbi:MAG: hypothetical protein QOF59_2136 [Actinomycetota bacterium]|nr:hypothetical protein [Actinomycetota bacterium]
MQTTQSTHWVWPYPAPPVRDAPALGDENQIDPDPTEAPAAKVDERKLGVPPRERDARREIDRLRDEIEHLVRAERDDAPQAARAVVDSALESVTRLQIVTANIDACGPPPATFAGPALVALADSRLTGHSDAIERGMEYTADNQLRLLNGEK